MRDDLEKLIALARAIPSKEADRELQRRSFAYGNTHFENPSITRQMVDQQAEILKQVSNSQRTLHNVGKQ